MPVNHRFIKALFREPVDKTPVWVMRQAGRYLPEYREVRARVGGFMELCRNTELATEVTLQPLRRYDLDAAILFSDILTIPDAMGLGLQFVEGKGPQFSTAVDSRAAVDALRVPDPATSLRYVTDAVSAIKRALNGSHPLIGFSGSPWTLACYMVDGGSSKEFQATRKMMYSDPVACHKLLSLLAESVTSYLNAQIDAGADAVMLFDSWAGLLPQSLYQTFSLQYLSQIFDGLNRERNGQRIPVILYAKNGSNALEARAASGCDALGLDWTVDIGEARQRVGDKVALQGNLDPALLYASPERLQQGVREVCDAFGPHAGHVFNLGHGITPQVAPDNMKVLVDAVHAYGKTPAVETA